MFSLIVGSSTKALALNCDNFRPIPGEYHWCDLPVSERNDCQRIVSAYRTGRLPTTEELKYFYKINCVSPYRPAAGLGAAYVVPEDPITLSLNRFRVNNDYWRGFTGSLGIENVRKIL